MTDESGDSAFDALMARRNGEPLPEPPCPHFTFDITGNCWTCADIERERAMKADVWDECAKESHGLGWLHDWALSDLLARNPYRVSTPTVTGTEPGCTCGGMAACPQCQDRDAEITSPTETTTDGDA